jgi:methyl-accepting chemotaxis protein
LTATSNQQASGAAEQSQAVVAATTSLEELSYSASQIAENARQVATSIARVLEVAHQVHGVSGQTESIALNGKAAVEATINGFTRTSQRIEVLAHHLLALTERSKKITTIIDLLDEIASETHLLSLNAAIESAGAGTAGQRFSVVAAEIKNLADRSVESTKEVREIIGELQGAVAGAVLAAEEGRKEANRSAEKAHLSGQVIIQVTEAVLETSRFGNMIVEFAENASSLAEEISLATNQQRSASDQIVATIHQVKQVAHETASSCRYIAQSAQQLSDLTMQLSTTLDLNKLEDSRLADQEALVA